MTPLIHPFAVWMCSVCNFALTHEGRGVHYHDANPQCECAGQRFRIFVDTHGFVKVERA